MLPGPYDDADARRYVRAALIPGELVERSVLDVERATAALRMPADELLIARTEVEAADAVKADLADVDLLATPSGTYVVLEVNGQSTSISLTRSSDATVIATPPAPSASCLPRPTMSPHGSRQHADSGAGRRGGALHPGLLPVRCVPVDGLLGTPSVGIERLCGKTPMSAARHGVSVIDGMSASRLEALGLRGWVFHDRRDAGRQLGERLQPLVGADAVVVGLPRGGIPVAFEVARAVDAPLDVLVVRKIGAPGHPELGMGAVAEGGVRVFNDDVLRSLLVSAEELEHAVARADAELRARAQLYRGERAALDLEGRPVILVDDGLATGGSARAAARAIRSRRPGRLVLAVPVGAPESIAALEGDFDDIVCLQAPETLWAIGLWYEDFGQTSDAEVAALLVEAQEPAGVAHPTDPPLPALPGAADPPQIGAASRRAARVPLPDGGQIIGDLVAPADAAGIVVFAHGSGSSRHSPRNRQVAAALNDAGLATLLIDLLTIEEERHRANVFDMRLLAQRLAAATRWVLEQPDLERHALGFFGASTGAGAALWAAADLGDQVRAVVSRGGRPDLAAPRLAEVRAPTLLIVGGLDTVVIQLNRDALAELRCQAHLEIVPGATHLFEEPGTLDAVRRLAAEWFARHLTQSGPAPQTPFRAPA